MTNIPKREAKVRFLKASNEARSVAHRYPLTTVLAAVGAGALFGGLVTFLASRKAS